ncbi:MAG: YifB family Mg chelatase-like AAA ATPase [Actinomycetota bacterium]
MYGKVVGVAVTGVRGRPVVVEAHIGRGLPSLTLTGMPGAAISDARDRIRPAVERSGLEWPLRRVVVNLSPGSVRKEGPGLDLPLALGVLAASRQVPHERLGAFAVWGELSLQGDLVPTPGALSVAIAVAAAGLQGVIVPARNAVEAALVEELEVVGVASLSEAVGFLRGTFAPQAVEHNRSDTTADDLPAMPDLAEVRGQARARRALEIAAAGGHNLSMTGPPGAGKTMLARRLPTILPPLARDEALEVTQLHSVTGLLDGGGLVSRRPFRCPHHSVSMAGLLGGGGAGGFRPGEISLAHHGVLLLDEVTEFRRDALEGLRQPLEDGRVVIARLHGSVEFPARCTLVTTANPCPCGRSGVPGEICSCSPQSVSGYRTRLSGPLLDRIDIRLDVPRVSRHELLGHDRAESSARVRDRVLAARARQAARLHDTGVTCNAHLPGSVARRVASLSADAERLLAEAVDVFGLTGRGFDRSLRVARTIADLEDASEGVSAGHLAEALSLRGGKELRRAG